MIEAATLVGIGGTITTIAAVEIGLAEYDRDALHRFVLTRAAAEDVFRTLATERLADRMHNPGLPRDRTDIIVGGCCVLLAVMRRLELKECVVSETDLLDDRSRVFIGVVWQTGGCAKSFAPVTRSTFARVVTSSASPREKKKHFLRPSRLTT